MQVYRCLSCCLRSSPWVQAFPWVLKNHVREHKHWQEDLGVSPAGVEGSPCYVWLLGGGWCSTIVTGRRTWG